MTLSRLGSLLAAGVLAGAAALSATAGAASPATAACRPALSLGVIPAWARASFSDPKPKLPHVVGRPGSITALVFGYPLLSPPSPTRSDKILWVSRLAPRPGGSDLRIRAWRMVGTTPVGRPVLLTVQGGPTHRSSTCPPRAAGACT